MAPSNLSAPGGSAAVTADAARSAAERSGRGETGPVVRCNNAEQSLKKCGFPDFAVSKRNTHNILWPDTKQGKNTPVRMNKET